MHAMSGDQLHAYRIQQAASVKAPYIGLAIALAILAVIIGLFKLPVIESAEAHGHATGSVWQHPRLVLVQWLFLSMWAQRFPSAAS
jgi:FHS family L-fucose permease-like MFS transporter